MFNKYKGQTINGEDKYSNVQLSSNMDERFDSKWKPGGTLLGVSGKRSSRAESGGSDRLGRCSWIDLGGKKGKIIRVMSAYRVSQESPDKVGDLTACKQQVRSLLKRGVRKPNPKRLFNRHL